MNLVRHDPASSRFETDDGAFAEYRIADGRMLLTHTWVPPALRGRKLAEQVVAAALDHARAEGMSVVPICSYVDTFLRRHSEFADLRAKD